MCLKIQVVYGTTGSVGSGDDSRVMSDKVQVLASSIYKEFETMIQKSGEDSVKNLMPLVVNVLECLDLAYLEKEEYSVDLEMLKEDNEQLMTQYEREKQLRRAQDQKCLEIEDSSVEQIHELESKIESLESIMRMLELKAKNASDHGTLFIPITYLCAFGLKPLNPNAKSSSFFMVFDLEKYSQFCCPSTSTLLQSLYK
ncbi:unnamed protein product [Anisakis simplex]|uniref:JNK-interacting protein (inferred by orthology to a C. elegans protein) n=1 Tax=Anisakis simplex TaxID=6269 RepID=A0A0M3J620_ANISI|nr:unnamed protein product [Anisakis simplex]